MNPGDWVQVWGQLVDGPTHPDDVLVEFFSHNEQYSAWVRADRVEPSATTPPFASRCPHLFQPDTDVLWQCIAHHGHGGAHTGSSGLSWLSSQSYGAVEEW